MDLQKRKRGTSHDRTLCQPCGASGEAPRKHRPRRARRAALLRRRCLVHFGLLQLGYIAWISALVGMAAGYFGYGLFSGRKNTVHGAILAVVFTMLMIVAAEYFGLAKEIFDAFKETYDIAFRDALASVPDFLTDAEIRTSVLKDLGIAFVFSILEAVFFIRDAVRKSKAAAAAETEAAAKNPAEF